jgi:Holliday junction resolvasome RuvABC endonuclease subunit
MKNHIIVGIDFSITSPAVTIISGKDVSFHAALKKKDCDLLFGVCRPSFNQLFSDPKAISADSWEDKQEYREIFIANQITDAVVDAFEMSPRNVDGFYIAIEGYSFGSKNTFAHKIGEATGCLIATLVRELPLAVNFFRPSPPSVKKAVGAKQKDGKQGVYDAFSKEFGVNLMEVLGRKKLDGPITDICDSWACAVWMQNHIDSLNQMEN